MYSVQVGEIVPPAPSFGRDWFVGRGFASADEAFRSVVPDMLTSHRRPGKGWVFGQASHQTPAPSSSSNTSSVSVLSFDARALLRALFRAQVRHFLEHQPAARTWTATKLEQMYREHHGCSKRWPHLLGFVSAREAFRSIPGVLVAIQRPKKGLVFGRVEPKLVGDIVQALSLIHI